MTRQAVDTEQRGTFFIVGAMATVPHTISWDEEGEFDRDKRIRDLLKLWDLFLESVEVTGNRYDDCVRERLRKLLYHAASHCVRFA